MQIWLIKDICDLQWNTEELKMYVDKDKESNSF